ncbi:MAG TPA: TerB family tellurite resistance protein [Gammaproteobacteria bacterium]|nr:TerB family tellurite resistance protein [Gammaproteobacteria bacterium]
MPMFTKLQKFFNQYLNEKAEHTIPLERRLHMATAALMVEMLHADEQVTEQEELRLNQLLKQRFKLSEAEIASLIDLANNEKHEATDYYQFTSLLNEHYSQQQKVELVEDLWKLAYADHELDKYEEHLLRRLAELLHVPHRDFIRTKHKVLND